MANHRIAILDDYQAVAQLHAEWESLGPDWTADFFHQPLVDTAALVAALQPYEVMVLMRERTPISGDLLRQLPRLRLIVTTGMANASIDVASARAQGVEVCGTESSPAPVAELTFALILGLARHVVLEAQNLKVGRWQTTVGTDLAGKTLGILGLGRIGSRVARIGQAFDMKTIAWSTNLTAEATVQLAVKHVDFDELLRTSDVLTIHTRLSDRTKNLISRTQFEAMKNSALLVNTSRSGIVVTADLLDALNAGLIAGAGLDVFDVEPLPAHDPLRNHDRILSSPHLGYVSQDNYATFYGQALEDIKAYLAGSILRPIG